MKHSQDSRKKKQEPRVDGWLDLQWLHIPSSQCRTNSLNHFEWWCTNPRFQKKGPYFVKEVYCILKSLSLSFLISHHHLFSHSKTSSRTGLINLYWAWRVKITWLVRSIYISSAFECDSEIHKVIKTTSRFIAFKTCFGLIIINGDLNFGMLSNQISGLGHDLKSRSTPA